MVYDASKDTHSLFKGQRSRNLSQDDWNKFYRSIGLTSLSDKERKKFEAAKQEWETERATAAAEGRYPDYTKLHEGTVRSLTEEERAHVWTGFHRMAETTTGRMRIHETTEANSDTPIKVNEESPFPAAYSERDGEIYLHPDILKNETAETVGNKVLHEFIHDRQKTGSHLINDAETQAASTLMAIESGDTSSSDYDPVYAQKHQKNLETWGKIVKGEEALPDWAEPFEYTPAPGEDVNSPESQERRAAAQEAYVQENASLQTQADYIHEYYASRETRDKNLASGNASWQVAYKSEQYAEGDRTDVQAKGEPAELKDDKVINDIASRNPAVNKDLLMSERQKLIDERSGADLPDSYMKSRQERLNELSGEQIKNGRQTASGKSKARKFANDAKKYENRSPQAGTGTPQKLGEQRGDKRGRLAAATPVNDGQSVESEGQTSEGAVATNDTSNTGDVRGTLRASQERKGNLENENTIVNTSRSGGAEIA